MRSKTPIARCLDSRQTCEYLGCSLRHLYKISSQLSPFRHGSKLMFDVVELDHYVEKLKQHEASKMRSCEDLAAL